MPDIRWSEIARTAIKQAEVKAEELGHHYCGSGHLLLALSSQEDGAVVAIFKELHLKPEKVIEACLEYLKK